MADDTETLEPTAETVPLPRARPPEAESEDDSLFLSKLQTRDPTLTADAPPADSSAAAPSDDKFIADMTGVQRGYSKVVDENTRRFSDLVTRDREQLQQQYQRQQFAAGAMPPPWQADKERAERIRGPFENFGSVATIFGLFASAATRTPLTSALNAGAAAMTAIRNSDEKAYESAYEAWKDNTNLAIKQFEMENKLFDNAREMMTTDLATWRATSLANEASFNNKKALLLLENGLFPEYIQAKEAQAKAALSIQKSMWEGEQFDTKHRIFKVSVDEFNTKHPDALPADKAMFKLNLLRGLNSEKGIYGFAEQQVADGVRQYMQEHGREPPPEVKNKMVADALAGRYVGRAGAQVDQAVWNGFYQEAIDAGKPEHEARAYATKKESETHSRAVPRAPAPNRLGTEAEFIESNLAEYTKPVADGGKGLSDREARLTLAKEWAERKQVFTAEQKRRLDARIHTINNSLEIFNTAEGLLDKKWGLPGSTGYARRALETVGNLFGIDSTEAVMFKHNIDKLQAFSRAALFDRDGRPLSSESQKMDDIIAGLSMTSTTVNTKEAFKELRKLYKVIRQQIADMREGKPAPLTGNAPAATTPSGGDWYKNAPGYKP